MTGTAPGPGSTVLVGDVGGTNARLAIASVGADGAVSLGDVVRKPTRLFKGLDGAVAEFAGEITAAGHLLPSRAVFALAGPTGAREIHMTNLGWTVNADALAARFGFASVRLINDFAAQARAVPAMAPDRFEELAAGPGVPGEPVVVLGPGTGLGMAILVPHRGGPGWDVVPTEGGHQAFGPCDARERKVLDHLSQDLPFVSFETVVSGPGLDRIYRALCAIDGQTVRLSGAPEIGPAATSGDDPVAVEAARMLAMMLATFAGDAVLSSGARGGCVIAGGVAEALAQFLRDPDFLPRLRERGPISHYFDGVPVRRAKDGFAALVGAALMAG
jgi:glucokinase